MGLVISTFLFLSITLSFIFYPTQIQKPATITDYKQLACMARNIYFEAGHEPFQGKIAVAVITMNRVKHQAFPDNICDVVYQRNRKVCQFSWTCKKKKTRINEAKYMESIEAARLVMQGKAHIDILDDALYYHADYVNPRWNKRKVAKIGRHIFYEPRNKFKLPHNQKI